MQNKLTYFNHQNYEGDAKGVGCNVIIFVIISTVLVMYIPKLTQKMNHSTSNKLKGGKVR